MKQTLSSNIPFVLFGKASLKPVPNFDCDCNFFPMNSSPSGKEILNTTEFRCEQFLALLFIQTSLNKPELHITVRKRFKQSTFRATTNFPAKRRLRNERKISILMTRHYPDLGSASDWLKQISRAARPIRIEILRSCFQTSFYGESSSGVTRCQLFSQGSSVHAEQGRKLHKLPSNCFRCLASHNVHNFR